PIDLSPTMEGYPTARISRDAGFNIHWSGDSSKVYWSLGPELYTRDLSRTFTFLGQNLQKADEAESKGVNISFTAKTDIPDGAIAFTGARIITASGDTIENGTVVVEGSRITGVGRSVAVPAGAQTIDARGKTIMPGIVDVHGHVGGENDGILAQAVAPRVEELGL